MERSRLERPARRPRDGTPPPLVREPAARVLALQRAAGNQAVARLLGHGVRPPGIQRLVARVDDPDDLEGKSATEHVKTAEVTRMAEYLAKTHGTAAIDLHKVANVPVGEGDHWFAGHGSSIDIGTLDAKDFRAKLDFQPLGKGQVAKLHLVSCNLGDITEKDVFAKVVRQQLQKDPALEGKTIIVAGAPGFVVHTEGAKGSFPDKAAVPELSQLKKDLVVKEKAIDAEFGVRFWDQLRAVLEDQARTPTLPPPSAITKYLRGKDKSGQDAAKLMTAFIKQTSPEYRGLVVKALNQFAQNSPGMLLRSAQELARIIDTASPQAQIAPLVTQVRSELAAPAMAAWLEFEAKVKPLEAKAAGTTLGAGDSEARGHVKSELKKQPRNEAPARQYGWIEFSTKGKYKGPPTEEAKDTTSDPLDEIEET